MRQSRNKTSRVLQLIFCLSLIGGIGCVSSHIPTPEEQIANQQAIEKSKRQIFEALQRKAAAGDLFASTQLGIDYAGGNRYLGVEQDVPRGILLLEQAAAKQYAPAEYALGAAYLTGKIATPGIQMSQVLVPRQPARGMELLKQSASHACTPRPLASFINTSDFISHLYRNGQFVDADVKQADLWRARSILHCNYPNAQAVVNVIYKLNSMTPQSKIEAMTLLLLMPPSDTAKSLQSTLPPEDLQTAINNSAALRQAVADSEKQYPAPPSPGKP